MRRSPVVIGATVLTLGILSVTPAGRPTDSSEAGASGNMKGEPAAPGEAAVLNLSPFRLNQNLALGAVSESSDEDAELDKLAKQLSNPVASLISVPFQANEDWGMVLPVKATSLRLTFSRLFRSQLAKTGT